MYVRLPRSERDSIADLLNYRMRVPGQDFVPLGVVADLSEGLSPSMIKRRPGRPRTPPNRGTLSGCTFPTS